MGTIRKFMALFLSLLTVLLFVGCEKKEAKTVVIGYQQGVGSTAFIVMEKAGLLDDFLPKGYAAEYTVMSGGGTAIREALSTGTIDIGLMGTPPVVIGADKQLPIKIICGISASPISLLTNKASIQSIQDIKDEKIAILAFGSIQQISLAMVADKVFGDPAHFDNNIVTLPETEAYVAMESGAEVSAYFGLNPTKTRLKHLPGIRELDSTTNYDIKISSLIACVNTDYAKENPEISAAIRSALQATFEWMEKNPDETVTIVSEVLGIDKDILVEVYTEEKFSTEVFGYDACADYMRQLGIIENEPTKLEAMMAE